MCYISFVSQTGKTVESDCAWQLLAKKIKNSQLTIFTFLLCKDKKNNNIWL